MGGQRFDRDEGRSQGLVAGFTVGAIVLILLAARWRRLKIARHRITMAVESPLVSIGEMNCLVSDLATTLPQPAFMGGVRCTTLPGYVWLSPAGERLYLN